MKNLCFLNIASLLKDNLFCFLGKVLVKKQTKNYGLSLYILDSFPFSLKPDSYWAIDVHVNVYIFTQKSIYLRQK